MVNGFYIQYIVGSFCSIISPDRVGSVCLFVPFLGRSDRPDPLPVTEAAGYESSVAAPSRTEGVGNWKGLIIPTSLTSA